jgi:pyruvate/2-oxoglutarate dehydrogenase complex dihydrolipoamide acyltransferase (E2) component
MPETATVQIPMPEMGESVTEGVVLEWHVAEGDAVKEGDTIVEVSTDKVDAEVPAPMDGVITKLVAQVDDEVPVGAPLAEMEAGEGTTEGPGAGAAGPQGTHRLLQLRRRRSPLRRHPRQKPLVALAAPTVGQATEPLMFVRRPLLGELPRPTALIWVRWLVRDQGPRSLKRTC